MKPAFGSWRVRFSLVTLAVIAALGCAWLGWNARQVDQRDFVLEAIEARGGSITRVEFFRGPGTSPKPLPLVWSLCGAKPIESIALPSTLYTDVDVGYVKSMF